ncbi:MAG: BREX-1 system phosphatase PglZ type A [Staphylococcus equorum]|nr:BREX-1 system phosphatase PglZ type A [Staphylococcus equorum]
MSNINLEQIEDKLNQHFSDYGPRKIVFWFDENQDFIEDIDHLNIENAKVYHLDERAQFKAKRELEYINPVSNYLVYAPFARWEDTDENNHLLSILKYSEEFNADRLAILMSELNIPQRFHKVVEQYKTFFNSKNRVERFSYFSTPFSDSVEIEQTIMAVLLKSSSRRLNDLFRVVLQRYADDDKDPLAELAKYQLDIKFWQLVEQQFGYKDIQPTLEKLANCLFLNYFYEQVDREMPEKFKFYQVIYLRNNIVIFIDQFMNDTRYMAAFDRLSEKVYHSIDGEKLIDSVKIDDLMEVDVFSSIHQRILHFYAECLAAGDTTTKVAGKTIVESIDKREKLHFGHDYKYDYQLLKHAFYLVNEEALKVFGTTKELLQRYEQELYWVDTHYRKVVWNSDRVQEKQAYDNVLSLVEMNYTRFLDQVGKIWNESLTMGNYPSIRNFYDQSVVNKSVRTVVIISDAFRFELAKNLQRQLDKEKKFNSEIKSCLSVLPSVTEFGKAALLPHKELTYEDGAQVLADGQKTNGLVNRNEVLQNKNAQSLAVNFEDIVAMNRKELRNLMSGKGVIYIYHDQVDKNGDHANEKAVFDACEKAIKEIFKFIQRMHNAGSVYRFVVTADHGFIYRRSKIAEADKIENPSTNKDDRIERRFVLSKNDYTEMGTKNYSLGEALNNDDLRNICVPITSNIFKKAGGGQNYIHGGASIQEMLVPVLEVTAAKGSNAKESVSVELMTNNYHIIGLSTSLEFYQKQAVNENYAGISYYLYFEDEQGERISNTVNYVANSRDTNANRRFSKFDFEFVNQKYTVEETYYLVMKHQDMDLSKRIKFIIDNPFD